VGVRVNVAGPVLDGDGDWERAAVGEAEGARVPVAAGVAVGGCVPTGQNEPGRMVSGACPKVSG
jgi:hypothetical protein